MAAGGGNVNENVVLDEGMQAVEDAAMDEVTQAASDAAMEAARRPSPVFPVLTVENPSTQVDTSNIQEKLLDTMAEEELPSFPIDSTRVPLSMDQCLNLVKQLGL
ncbi:uncharacterized protein LOC113319649 [Papaver somniferum]|uniref:uncharacterized protein LOC113319649 n=1 Tax=Papaver somniferum TaxID=3469 RepID=UPI000E704F30|nr:uncharacterized protein LOC113319649 [Papaver somniferum]